MHLAFTNPAYPAGYNPSEAALLRRKFLATKVEGSCPINHMQALVVTFDVACDIDMSQEAPVVLAEVTSPEIVLFAQPA